MLQKQGANLCFLIRDMSGFAEKQSGNDLIKSPTLGVAFRNGKGADVTGIVRSCPWNWYIWSDSDETLHTVGREGWLGDCANFY